MDTFRVHIERTKCACFDIEAEDEAHARAKALELSDAQEWCEGHGVEVVGIDRLIPDDD